MPIYEYICLKCQHKFEYLTTLSKEKDNNPVCPKCQSDQVKKLISSFGIGGGSSRIKSSGSGGCSSCSSSSCSTCR